MKKNLFLCLFALLGFLSAAAQTTGNKGFKLNVNYLDCGDITQPNKAGAYTIESWVNITLDDLDDRFIIFKKEQPDERNRIQSTGREKRADLCNASQRSRRCLCTNFCRMLSEKRLASHRLSLRRNQNKYR